MPCGGGVRILFVDGTHPTQRGQQSGEIVAQNWSVCAHPPCSSAANIRKEYSAIGIWVPGCGIRDRLRVVMHPRYVRFGKGALVLVQGASGGTSGSSSGVPSSPALLAGGTAAARAVPYSAQVMPLPWTALDMRYRARSNVVTGTPA